MTDLFPNKSRLTASAVVVLCASLPIAARAQSGPANASGSADNATIELPQIDINGQRGTSSTAIVGPPPPAYAGGQVATGGRVGLLGNRSNADTPFTQTNFTEQLIRDEQDRRLLDVLNDDPSVRAVQSPFAVQPNIYIRGLLLNARDFAFDGLYGIASIYRPQLEGVERVEVLNGPAALLYGFPPNGGSAGVINLVPKRAGDTPLSRVTAEYASDATGGGSFDIGRRFGGDGAFGIRVNGAYREGETPIHDNHERFGDFILGADYRMDDLRVSIDAGYQKFDQSAAPSSFSVRPGFAIPRAPSLIANVHNVWEQNDATQIFGVVRVEYDLRPNLTAYATLGGSKLNDRDVASDFAIVSARGDLTSTTYLPLDSTQQQWTAEAGLRAQVQIGSVTDKLALGYSHYASYLPYEFVFGASYASNLYTPVSVPRPVFPSGPAPFTQLYENLDGVSLINTFSILDDRVQLLAGGRFQVAEENTNQAATGARAAYSSKDAGTPLAALIVKPVEPVSLYVSYVQGFGFGPTAPANAINANQTFPPVVTEQIETGAKLDFGRVGGSFALFQTTVPSGFTDPSTRVFGVNGEQRNRGIDITVFGSPLRNARVLGGVTLLDATLTQTAGGALNGRIVPGAPAVQINVGGEYDLPWIAGMTVSARVIHTSHQYYDQANTQGIPAWTRLDLGARYGFEWSGKPVAARFNVQNALGTDYWASTGQGNLTLGTPQTFLFSLSSDL